MGMHLRVKDGDFQAHLVEQDDTGKFMVIAAENTDLIHMRTFDRNHPVEALGFFMLVLSWEWDQYMPNQHLIDQVESVRS